MPFKISLIFALLFILSSPLQADNLNIPGHDQSASNIVMPTRGMSMDSVLEQYGEPVRRIEAIGQPPITEWDYGDYRVFFEYQTVLHSLDLTTLIMPR
ncbi:MAG: hypothetical protein KAI17_12930 [Thiotrichaceae bacterium]|nr:hypothetical protein [Thiotrichaceae bacterium]